jgi:single-stranded DNA-binding protein
MNLESGKKKAMFSFAANETYTDASGECVVDRQWHTIYCVGPSTEVVEKYVQMGPEIAVSGKIQKRFY